jgi:mono/diheme cytochrome c family protein
MKDCIPRRSLLWAALMLLSAVPLAAQQNGGTAGAQTMRSTASGVYTKEQATRGGEMYRDTCDACHGAAMHRGPAFTSVWGGRPLAELFARIIETMPESDPGSLSPAQTADLVAYLLQLNGMPAGEQALPEDRAALRTIRLDAGTGRTR